MGQYYEHEQDGGGWVDGPIDVAWVWCEQPDWSYWLASIRVNGVILETARLFRLRESRCIVQDEVIEWARTKICEWLAHLPLNGQVN